MLITFEGIEGSGKSTQVDLLYAYLVGKGQRVVKTREPGGTSFGEALRKAFLKRDTTVYPLSELLVFMAMRAQHVEEVILPSLQDGKIVLCDRFVDATYAYQGYGRGIDLGIIETLNRLVTKGVRPNLTLLVDCPVKVGLRRKAGSDVVMDRFETEATDFHRAVRKAYLKLAKEDPKRFVLVDGRKGVDEVHRVVRGEVERVISSHGI